MPQTSAVVENGKTRERSAQAQTMAWLGRGLLVSLGFTLAGLAVGYIFALGCRGEDFCGITVLVGGLGGYSVGIATAAAWGATASRKATGPRVFRGTAAFGGSLILYAIFVILTFALLG